MERTLNNKKDQNFVLSHLIIEKNCIISSLKKSIKISKEYYLSREKIRDTFIDTKTGKKELEKIINELHLDMLHKCKSFNKNDNKKKQYETQKKKLLNNIELLKQYINKNKNKNKPLSDINYIDKEEERRKGKIIHSERVPKVKPLIDKKNSNNTHTHIDIIGEFPKIGDLFDFSSEEDENENIIDEELHSDDENNFMDNIQPQKQLSTYYKKQIKDKIPRFNFDQINFNKAKAYVEIDMYSLERREFNFKNIDFQNKEIKKRINLLKEKIELMKKKDIAMKEYLIKFKQKLDELKSLIYQKTEIDFVLTSDFISQSLKRNMAKNDLNNFNDEIIGDNDKTFESIILEENGKEKLMFESIIENENEDENESKKVVKYEKNENVEKAKNETKVKIKKNYNMKENTDIRKRYRRTNSGIVNILNNKTLKNILEESKINENIKAPLKKKKNLNIKRPHSK